MTADTQFLTHSIHRYSGKFIPQIARQALELISLPGDLVLDPYCGSGTTLLEAALAGRRAIGVDLNPLAVLISKVKTTPVAERVVAAFMKGVDALLMMEEAELFSLIREEKTAEYIDTCRSDARYSSLWHTKWFKPSALRGLIAIEWAIKLTSSGATAALGTIALSDILRKVSNAHGSYPNVMFDRKKGEPLPPIPLFRKRLEEICSRVSLLTTALDTGNLPTVIRGDARQLPLGDGTVDAIVTHPPYIGSIPYAEYGYLSLTWFGYDANSIDAKLTGGNRQSRDVVDRFETAFGETLSECRRVLKLNGHAFLLLGMPTVKGQRIDLPAMAKHLATKSGLGLAAEASRTGINRRANLMGEERLLFFRRTH